MTQPITVRGPRAPRVHILRPNGAVYTYCNREPPGYPNGWIRVQAPADCPKCLETSRKA